MFENHWTFFDAFFLIVVLASTILALMKGLAREVFSVVALIVGFILAVLYYPIPAARLVALCRTEAVANLLGFLIIFLGCLLVGAIASFIANRFLKAVALKWVDRFLGAIFGFLRGWAICSVLVIGLIAFPVKESIMEKSILAPYLLGGASAIVHLAPQALKNQFHKHYQKVLQAWNHARSDA